MGGDSIYQYFSAAVGSSSTLAIAVVEFPVEMRIPPSSYDAASLRVTSFTGNDVSVDSVTIESNTKSKNSLRLNLTTAGSITASRPYWLGANNSTSAYLGFSSEL
jgi:hypothetical protein